MEWFIILALIVLGVSLIIVEVIFIPGTTVVGFIGFGIGGFGIYFCYDNYGNTAGTIVLLASLLLVGIVLVVAFKTGVWKKLSLRNINDGKVNSEFVIDLHENQTGIAVSALKPVGKAEFNEKEYEVYTLGDYVDTGMQIKIISIKGRKILVEPIK